MFACPRWSPSGFANRASSVSAAATYPFTPLGEPAPTESTPPRPVGEYATTVWGRERVMEHVSATCGTPICLLRLNYAVEARYGVLVDLGELILAGRPVDLAVPEMNFIWQGYANAVALAAFGICRSPAEFLNLTGTDRHRTRDLARSLGQRLGVEPVFQEPEGDSALVSDATRCQQLFGPPEIDAEGMLDQVAAWLKSGAPTLGKPTKFATRDGRY